MSEENELLEAINGLTAQIGQIADRKDAKKAAGATAAGPETDGIKELADKAAKYDAALYSLNQDQALRAKREQDADVQERIDAGIKAALKDVRLPSMAAAIGQGPRTDSTLGRMLSGKAIEPHPLMKASFADYQAGEFLLGMLNYKAIGLDGINIDAVTAGKAALESLGVRYAGLPSKSANYSMVDGEGKATLGSTNSTGGYVLPNNLVDTLIKPNTQRAVLQLLVTVRNGVNVRGVDMPYRLGSPARMTFQDWGTTKTNVNESYGSYTAFLGTLGAIYDISKQYARFSAGSAEQDIIDELGKAAILGENYYMVAGANITGTVGSGDPTYGIYTALNAASAFLNYSKTPTTGASSSTLLGSFANVLTQVQGQLAGRNRMPSAYLVDHTTYFTAAGQGSDTAGFWNAPEGPAYGGPAADTVIPGFGRTPSGGLSYWGIPVYYDTNLGTNATTKIVIGGEWDVLKLFRGMEFRIDTSDQAGTRWDQNLIGFRGEEEIGFHAGPGVNVGAFQMYTSVIP
jgi:Phage capsid family